MCACSCCGAATYRRERLRSTDRTGEGKRAGQPAVDRKGLAVDVGRLVARQKQRHSGDFRETGFLDTLDPRTRKRMPNPSIELAADAPAATIEVRYVDTSGELQGPFPIRFDPEAAHIVLRAAWPRIDLTTVDISVKTQFSKSMMAEIVQSKSPAA